MRFNTVMCNFLPRVVGVLVTVVSVVSIATSVAAQTTPTACTAANVRWASSSNTMYVVGSTTLCTLTDLKTLLPRAPLQLIDAEEKIWWLGATLVLQQGATVHVRGDAVGGDVNELRLKSNNTSTTSNIVWIKADWGNLLFDHVKVTSWDDAEEGPDERHSTQRRAYIQARSSLGSEGTPRQSRLDIHDSEVAYLGHNASEAYGLSWKVNGKQAGLFDLVDVFGDVTNSHIHHNYFGGYTYGAFGSQWVNNDIHDNVVYGFDPHDNSDQLRIENNRVYDNGLHGIICSKYCDHLTIRGNEVFNNGGNGIMLHREVNDSLVEDNETYDNVDGGIALFDAYNNVVRGNTTYGNDKGIRLSAGSADNLIEGNTVRENIDYGLYLYKGNHAPLVREEGRPHDNTFVDNEVTDNGQYGLKIREADDNTFTDNRFIKNGRSLLIEDSRGNSFEDNEIRGNGDRGFMLRRAVDHTFLHNLIVDNDDVGVYVDDGSHRAEIRENTISDHQDYGIRVRRSDDAVIADNIFSDNGEDIGD